MLLLFAYKNSRLTILKCQKRFFQLCNVCKRLIRFYRNKNSGEIFFFRKKPERHLTFSDLFDRQFRVQHKTSVIRYQNPEAHFHRSTGNCKTVDNITRKITSAGEQIIQTLSVDNNLSDRMTRKSHSKALFQKNRLLPDSMRQEVCVFMLPDGLREDQS